MTGGLVTTKPIEPADVLAFWRSAGPDKWFEKDALFDAEIAQRFSCLWRAASEGKLRHWEETAEGALALVVVFDQFPAICSAVIGAVTRPTSSPARPPIAPFGAASTGSCRTPSGSSSICR